MLANLPSFVIGFKDQQDARAFSSSKKRLRRRYSLSFLNPKNINAEDCDEDHDFPRQAFLYKVNYSLMLTGKSDQYWTAVCLDEDSFEDYPRLEPDEELELGGLEKEEEGAEDSEESQRTNGPDPITFTAQHNKQPRTYFLQAVATAHKRQVENHEEIKDLFETSLDSYVSRILLSVAARDQTSFFCVNTLCSFQAKPRIHLVIFHQMKPRNGLKILSPLSKW
jgi:hypothetical protein